MKQIKVILGAVLLQAGVALADAPNLVGNWEVVSGYSALNGTSTNPAPSELFQTPMYKDLIIDDQKENAFTGHLTRDNGEKRFLAGVFGPDGKSVFLSTDNGSHIGSVSQDNNQLSTCGNTVSSTRNRSYCTVFKRVK